MINVRVLEADVVRRASPWDIGVLAELERAANLRFLEIGFDLEVPVGAADLARATDVLHVVGDPPVGFALVVEVDGQAHLEELAVRPDYGRRGLGRALLLSATEWAASVGFGVMTLCTFCDVPWNAPFFSKFGFSPMSRLTPGLEALRVMEVSNGLDELGARVVMERPLGMRDEARGRGDRTEAP